MGYPLGRQPELELARKFEIGLEFPVSLLDLDGPLGDALFEHLVEVLEFVDGAVTLGTARLKHPRHLVEGMRQFANLVAAVSHARACRKISGLDLARGVQQRSHAPQHQDIAADPRRGDGQQRDDSQQSKTSLEKAVRLREGQFGRNADDHTDESRSLRAL